MLTFREWLKKAAPGYDPGDPVKGMQKINRKEVKPSGSRTHVNDLSKDYKGHIGHNGTVEPYKVMSDSKPEAKPSKRS